MADDYTLEEDVSESESFAGSGSKIPEMNLENAHKIIQFYQDEPQWLANPRTRIAASADFAQASKMVGMSIQIERVNNSSAAAKAKNAFSAAKIKGLSEVSQYVPVDDVDGQTELGRLNGMVGSPDFNLTDFANGVSRLQSKYKKPDASSKPTRERQLLNEAIEAESIGNLEEAEILRDAARRVQSIRKTAPIQNAQEYGRLIDEAAKETDPVKKALLIDQAQIVRGQKPATESISTTIRQVPDPLGGTNAPTSLTNVTTRVTGSKTTPVTPNREHAATMGAKRMADDAAATILDAATARAILDEAGGDKDKARELARQRGYRF